MQNTAALSPPATLAVYAYASPVIRFADFCLVFYYRANIPSSQLDLKLEVQVVEYSSLKSLRLPTTKAGSGSESVAP